MQSFIIKLVQIYLKVLGRIAPKTAGRQGFRMFCTPRFRSPVPGPGKGVLEEAEHLNLDVKGEGVVGFHWRHPARGDDAPLVVIVHGWESRAGRLAHWVNPLLEAGFQVAAFDAPAHGASEGKRSNPLKFALALNAVVEAINRPVAGLVCHSVGALAGILALGGGSLIDRPNLPMAPDGRLVVLAGAESGVDGTAIFCRFLNLNDAFQERMLDAVEETVGMPMTAFDAHRLFPNQPLPTLWFHAPEDPEVFIESAHKMARLSDQILLEEMPGLGHHRIARDPDVIRRGVAFLAESLPAN